jgi:hypothetical protein
MKTPRKKIIRESKLKNKIINSTMIVKKNFFLCQTLAGAKNVCGNPAYSGTEAQFQSCLIHFPSCSELHRLVFEV